MESFLSKREENGDKDKEKVIWERRNSKKKNDLVKGRIYNMIF